MTLGIVANSDRQAVKKLVPEVVFWLKKRGIGFAVEACLAQRLGLDQGTVPILKAEEFRQHCQMVLSFGGDGTILSTARIVGDSGIPILGVKIGGMGFLAELNPEELFDSLEEIVKGRYELVERQVLRAEVKGKKGVRRTLFALNDFVLDKGAVSRVIRIKTFIDEELLNTYIGDGLIISSATGSTAYSLAAGGPILLPSMEAIIINPISPHTLGARPVVIPGDKHVRVQVEFAPQQVMLHADGQLSQPMVTGQSANIRTGDFAIKLISYSGRSFYDVLHAKLNWGEDIRENSQDD